MSDKRTLTTGEIAEYCGVNFRTVIRWINRGWLKAYQLPGRGDNRVEIPEFLRFLREHQLPIPEAFIENRDRVLIIDDEPEMSSSIQRLLRREGYQTLVANDGFRAGSLLSIFRPAVLTLDLQMPGIGGMEVLKYIREKEDFAGLRILIVSALAGEKLEEALALGADDVLEKPFEKTDLLRKIARLSGRGQPKTVESLHETTDSHSPY
ncbi:MAG: response regulator [Candidatus Melainabacteria bacterium]